VTALEVDVAGHDQALELAALLPANVLADMAVRARETVARARRDGITLPAETVAALALIVAAASTHRGADSAADCRGGLREWVSTTRAARIAGVDSRAVRHARQRGVIAYRARESGKGWEVEVRSLQSWVNSRTSNRSVLDAS
jgi:hypothetical protein